jgi:hypothetical protein
MFNRLFSSNTSNRGTNPQTQFSGNQSFSSSNMNQQPNYPPANNFNAFDFNNQQFPQGNQNQYGSMGFNSQFPNSNFNSMQVPQQQKQQQQQQQQQQMMPNYNNYNQNFSNQFQPQSNFNCPNQFQQQTGYNNSPSNGLTSLDIAFLRDYFHRVSGSSGYLNRETFTMLMQQLLHIDSSSAPFVHIMISNMFSTIDRNNDGQIDFNEFLRAYASARS